VSHQSSLAGGPVFGGHYRSVVEVLEVMAACTAIEQAFKDARGWRSGPQPVWNVYARLGAMAINLLWYSVVEMWAWLRREDRVGGTSAMGRGGSAAVSCG